MKYIGDNNYLISVNNSDTNTIDDSLRRLDSVLIRIVTAWNGRSRTTRTTLCIELMLIGADSYYGMAGCLRGIRGLATQP